MKYKILKQSLRRHIEEFEVEANSEDEAEKKLSDAPDEKDFMVYNDDNHVSYEIIKTEKIEDENI